MTIEESELFEAGHASRLGAEITRAFIEAAGRRISYLIAGDAAARHTILLIHGSGVSARSWAYQLDGLSATSRVVAVDLPGHGKSDPTRQAGVRPYADAVAGVLDTLHTGPVVVTGHSLGGAVALLLATLRPAAVRGLVLLSTCAKLPPIEGSGERFLAYLPWPLRRTAFFSMAKDVLFAPGAPGRAVSLAMQEIRSCRRETILRDFEAATTMDLAAQATHLDVPTLILCGSRDRLTPPALSRSLGELIRGSRFGIIEEAGHMLPLEVADRVNHEISNFVGSIVRSREGPRFALGAGARSLLGRLRVWPGALRRKRT